MQLPSVWGKVRSQGRCDEDWWLGHFWSDWNKASSSKYLIMSRSPLINQNLSASGFFYAVYFLGLSTDTPSEILLGCLKMHLIGPDRVSTSACFSWRCNVDRQRKVEYFVHTCVMRMFATQVLIHPNPLIISLSFSDRCPHQLAGGGKHWNVWGVMYAVASL